MALLITAFFSYRGYARAVENAEHGYSVWALQNNQFAAELAAERVTGQLTRYFELANTEAQNAAFLPLFFNVADESPALAKLNDSVNASRRVGTVAGRISQRSRAQRAGAPSGSPHGRVSSAGRARLLASPASPACSSPIARGTQLASAFDDQSISLSIGKNWAHRTYFHGGSEELSPLDRPPESPAHVEQTHLSAVFFSSSQKTWKVAISTPIFRDRDGKQQFEGILVLTVDLADFHVSAATTKRDHDQFLVLVDARPGADEGTILHHPLFEEMAAKGKAVPDDVVHTRSIEFQSR